MKSDYIKVGNALVYYRLFGSGQTMVFCFHGYGRDGASFEFLAGALGQQYTLVAIDMPHHGKTEWPDKLTFHPEHLVQVVQTIRRQMLKEHEKFLLLGFSMGGRIALHLTEILHRHIARLVLVAPDGLNTNFWRWFCTHTWIGNMLLAHAVHHPGWLLYLLQMAEKARVINSSVADFVHYYLDDEVQRKVLYTAGQR